MGEIEPIYSFEMTFWVTEVKKGVSETTAYTTEIEKFAVFGGSKRTIKRRGENGIGDADIMSEFYQAKQFLNLIVTCATDSLGLVFRRLFDRQMHFAFKFVVKSLSTESRFRHLQLVTKKALIVKPPSPVEGGDTLNIKYSSPQVFYWHSNESSLVGEKI
jgi:hypothetical protein